MPARRFPVCRFCVHWQAWYGFAKNRFAGTPILRPYNCSVCQHPSLGAPVEKYGGLGQSKPLCGILHLHRGVGSFTGDLLLSQQNLHPLAFYTLKITSPTAPAACDKPADVRILAARPIGRSGGWVARRVPHLPWPFIARL